MSGPGDLAAVARAFGLRIKRETLEQWAPILRALFDDLARMIDLPIEECEPAFLAGRLLSPPPEGTP